MKEISVLFYASVQIFWYISQGIQQCFSNCFACGTCNFGIKFHGTVFESLLQIVQA
jgi:hypothetical protein